MSVTPPPSQEGRVGVRALFAIIYATSVSSVYFALGVVAHHAQGLTPEVFILAGLFFQLSGMTFAEGASLHPQRGGSATFARYAFNELISFITGWAIVLDYIILVAVAALAVPAYLGVFWPSLTHGAPRVIAAIVVIAVVSFDTLIAAGARRLKRQAIFSILDVGVQAALIIFGLILVFNPSHLTSAVNFGTAPTLKDLAFALPVGVVAFAGIEAASNLAADVEATPQQLRRLVGAASAAVVLVYIGIAVVGVGALPVHNGTTALGTEHLNAPVLGIAEALRPKGFADVFKYLVGITGAVGLIAASGAAMLGVSRVGYSMAVHRQIPSTVGRLSGRWNTPWIVIGAAMLAAIGLVLPGNMDALVGIYAFGAMVSLTVAHLSVIALRYKEPDAERTYAVPFSVRIGRAKVPLPTVLGAVLSAAGWTALVVFHQGARYVGLGWLAGGVLMYVAYRKIAGRPVFKQVVVPDRALRHRGLEPEFGSILVPLFGTELDDDIIQTAGRLAGEVHDDAERGNATIEAIYVLPVPMALPLDAPLPPSQISAARAALARAKEIGEEYEGVDVATAVVRARRIGYGIVQEARRRGVEVIVLAAEPPSGVRGGALLGGRGTLSNFVGEVTKYVVNKAPCRVILTAAADPRTKQGQMRAAAAERKATEVSEVPVAVGIAGSDEHASAAPPATQANDPHRTDPDAASHEASSHGDDTGELDG